jgi:hypothetical protein
MTTVIGLSRMASQKVRRNQLQTCCPKLRQEAGISAQSPSSRAIPIRLASPNHSSGSTAVRRYLGPVISSTAAVFDPLRLRLSHDGRSVRIRTTGQLAFVRLLRSALSGSAGGRPIASPRGRLDQTRTFSSSWVKAGVRLSNTVAPTSCSAWLLMPRSMPLRSRIASTAPVEMRARISR